uniref:DUF4378 domain-containing protein n=1 Tax=Oryza nivara TaxID=4536 RepID=A0A0E0FG89_ORYNI
MAQLLHHQDSAFYGKELHGRRWSILQFFGFRRRLRSTKMISDKKQSQGKGSGGSRRRGSYVPLKDEDTSVMDDDKHTETTKKNKSSKKSSGKGSLGSLILKKLYGKEGHKEKMLPVAPKLLRTLSIHYLESNEYVLDGESASNGDGSSQSIMPNSTDTNIQNATFNTQDGCDNDTSSSLLKRGDIHVKQRSHRSISMDGVLHKVPYGHKASEDVIKEGLSRSASATYDRDGLKSYTVTAAKRPVNQGFRRSRSLTESLEKYSHLLDSISSNQSKRTLTSSKSTRDHSLDAPAVMTGLQSLVMTAENLVIPEHALAPCVPERIIVDGDVDAAMDEISVHKDADGSENTVLIEEYIVDKKCGMHTTKVSEDGRISEEHTTTSDDKQIHSSDVLKSREDSSLKPRVLHLSDTDDSADMDLNTSTSMELSTAGLGHKNVQESDSDELSSLQADPKNEDGLIYVKNIFMKSSFRNEVLFDEWCSQNITVLQEEDCQHYEAAAAAFDFTEMSADQLLLSDLTNEVLLDIYKKYSVSKSLLSRFSSFDRPKPVGNHALKELWSKVSCHLDEQPQSSIEIDTILSNDLSKNDHWVNFQRDADHLGNMLADFVFDRLLTEFTLQLAKF